MKDRSSWKRRTLLLVSVVGLVLITVLRISSFARPATTEPPQQDVLRLENRITQLEQRLYAAETNIRNLDQQSRVGSMSSRNVTQEDLVSLHQEIQTLQQRLVEFECGLAKLDERTLTREIREARRKSGVTNNDPCRLSVDTPLRLTNQRQ